MLSNRFCDLFNECMHAIGELREHVLSKKQKLGKKIKERRDVLLLWDFPDHYTNIIPVYVVAMSIYFDVV